MILCLWSPLHPLSMLLAIQDHTQNLEQPLWKGGRGRSVLYLTDLWPGAIWSKKGRFLEGVSQHFCNWELVIGQGSNPGKSEVFQAFFFRYCCVFNCDDLPCIGGFLRKFALQNLHPLPFLTWSPTFVFYLHIACALEEHYPLRPKIKLTEFNINE